MNYTNWPHTTCSSIQEDVPYWHNELNQEEDLSEEEDVIALQEKLPPEESMYQTYQGNVESSTYDDHYRSLSSLFVILCKGIKCVQPNQLFCKGIDRGPNDQC